MYEQDPHKITQNIQEIINQSLDKMAPVQITQLKSKPTPKISQEAKNLLAERDSIFKKYKQTNDLEDYRHYKNVRNLCTKTISNDHMKEKYKKFNEADQISSKQKWDLIKTETGQKTFITPSMIREKDKIWTKPRDMAQALNRQYVGGIREIIKYLPNPPEDPHDKL